MIGAFARMFGRARVVAVEEKEGAYLVEARTPEGDRDVAESGDAPPEAFVQTLHTEGGDVFVVPILEAFRVWLRNGRQGDPPGLVPAMSENAKATEDEGERA